jgi:predicted permease
VPSLVSLRSRLLSLVRRDRLERDLDAELLSHIELQAEENRRRGMSPDEARRAAQLAFGGVAGVKEECREAFGTSFLDALLQDLRFGLRGLRRSPGYAAAAVATLALGIGANTAIFSVVRGVLLRPLPYARGEQLVALRQVTPQGGAELGWSIPELRDLRERAFALEAVVEYHSMNFTLLGGGEPRRVRTGVVSASYFDVLEVEPLLGRGFRAEDEQPDAEPVLLLAFEFWQRAWAGDAGVIGRRFEMNDRAHTVVGVLPPLPPYPDANDVFMPASACPFRARSKDARAARIVSAFARVKPGRTLEEARADVSAVTEQGGGARASLSPLREELVGSARPTLLILLGVAVLILLIACANVASLALARLLERGHELRIREALGAGRGRILRQLLTESTLLALLGGLLGLLLAALSRELLVSFAARFTPRAAEVRLDSAVLAFTLLLSVLTGALAGALPGLPRGRSPLKLRFSLVAGQLALSLVLVIGAALMLRSFAKLSQVDGGFQVEHVLALDLDLNWSKYTTSSHAADHERLLRFHELFLERALALPGVLAAGSSWTVPLNGGFTGSDGTFLIEGREPGAEPPRAKQVGASGGYFQAIGVPLLRGRLFTRDDRPGAPGVVIVSAALAARHFGALDPVGRRISMNRGRSFRTIVGVVGDVRQVALDRGPDDMLYLPFYEFPGFSSTFLVRAARDPAWLSEELRRTLRRTDPQAALPAIRTLAQIRSEALASPRLTTTLLGLFAGLALAISATGIAGVIAYSVSQRTQEFGVRMAMGAGPTRILALVVRQGLRTLLLGLGLGLLGALALARVLSRLLFGVTPTDPTSFLAATLLLLLVGLLACVAPARRAAGVDPLRALRCA